MLRKYISNNHPCQQGCKICEKSAVTSHVAVSVVLLEYILEAPCSPSLCNVV